MRSKEGRDRGEQDAANRVKVVFYDRDAGHAMPPARVGRWI